MKKICVIGSLNIDLVVSVDRFNIAGETITGLGSEKYYGGKGANQAVALGKLGADVSLFGVVGDDDNGHKYIQHLARNGVNTENIKMYKNEVTGSALIEVDNKGENRIIIIPGANSKLDNDYFESVKESLLNYDIFLFQLESPLSVVEKIIRYLFENNKIVILDPAPAQELSDELLKCVDYITPNASELELLSKQNIDGASEILLAARGLIKKGVKNVIAKSGSNGSYLIDSSEFSHIEAFKVNSVDTIAAGDAFNAGLSYALSIGEEIKIAIKIGNAVGALTTLGKGAQNTMPSIKEVKELLNTQRI